jgi:hypothetical protein
MCACVPVCLCARSAVHLLFAADSCFLVEALTCLPVSYSLAHSYSRLLPFADCVEHAVPLVADAPLFFDCCPFTHTLH